MSLSYGQPWSDILIANVEAQTEILQSRLLKSTVNMDMYYPRYAVLQRIDVDHPMKYSFFVFIQTRPIKCPYAICIHFRLNETTSPHEIILDYFANNASKKEIGRVLSADEEAGLQALGHRALVFLFRDVLKLEDDMVINVDAKPTGVRTETETDADVKLYAYYRSIGFDYDLKGGAGEFKAQWRQLKKDTLPLAKELTLYNIHMDRSAVLPTMQWTANYMVDKPELATVTKPVIRLCTMNDAADIKHCLWCDDMLLAPAIVPVPLTLSLLRKHDPVEPILVYSDFHTNEFMPMKISMNEDTKIGEAVVQTSISLSLRSDTSMQFIDNHFAMCDTPYLRRSVGTFIRIELPGFPSPSAW